MDPTLIRLAGWDDLARQVAGRQPARWPQVAFVAADNYGVAAILAHDLPGPVLGDEPRWALFALPHRARRRANRACWCAAHRRAGPPDPAPWTDHRARPAPRRAAATGWLPRRYDLFRVTAREDMVRLPSR